LKFIQPIENRKATFFQVLTGSIFTSLNQVTDEEFNSGAIPNFQKSPRWYSKEAKPYVYDPHVLVSSAHYCHIKDLREKMAADKDTIVFVDSGGYQLATGVKPKHTREKALEWSEVNGNLFPILDMPASRKYPLQHAIDFTVDSAKYYAENRTNKDCLVMNVLSSNDSLGMEKWYNAVKDFPLDGWCYGGHGNYLKAIIQSILFLEMKGEFKKGSNLHIFGTTSLGVIPYIIYAQYLLNKKGIDCQLSFDSSYAFRNASFGKYFIFPSFAGMGTLVLSNKFDWSGLTEFSHFGCDCPICQGVTDIGKLFEQGSHFYNIIGMHNFCMLMDYKAIIEGFVSTNVPGMIDSLPTEMKNNFESMRLAFDKMGKKGIDIIGDKFQTKNKPGLVMKSLSSFFS
jgi:hypothetical protein